MHIHTGRAGVAFVPPRSRKTPWEILWTLFGLLFTGFSLPTGSDRVRPEWVPCHRIPEDGRTFGRLAYRTSLAAGDGLLACTPGEAFRLLGPAQDPWSAGLPWGSLASQTNLCGRRVVVGR